MPPPPATTGEADDMLALTPDMRRFVDQHVDRRGSQSLKLQQLVSAIMDTEIFGLDYDDVTRTAAETFRARRGNCLSFSSLFVALARDAGLEVQFQEVDVPPDWTLDKETFVLNRHINVFVDLDFVGTRVVDFNIGDFRSSYPMRRISDRRARAHFFNNAGVERLQAGDNAGAFAFFRRALTDGDETFSPAWTNLGTLYQHNGHLAHAEAAYLHALTTGGSDLVAMSNLARLYERTGDRERAAALKDRVVHHRLRNPYYRCSLARDALAAGRLDLAPDHLKFAIKKRPNEDQFCFLLAVTYLRGGDEGAARRWFARAKELAATDAVRFAYASKVQALLERSRNVTH